LQKRNGFPVTIIEIKPFRNGWQVYESAGVQPVFLDQQDAINYATVARAFALARFAFWIQAEQSNASFHSMKRIENCD
jgi:hypothetical protein